MAFKLINARPSPYGRKIAIALHEKGIAYDVQYDVPWGNETCTPHFSPLEQLPILIRDDVEYIYDSVYIMDWLEARFPYPALLPSDTDTRLLVMKRRMLGERVMEFAQSLIFETHRPEPSQPWMDRQTRKIAGGLAELEKLSGNIVPKMNDAINQGDIAIATSLLGLEFAISAGLSPDLDVLYWRGRYPRITRLIEALEVRPSFVATKPATMDVNLKATVN